VDASTIGKYVDIVCDAVMDKLFNKSLVFLQVNA
jgi:hypothetical protein